MGRTFCGLTFRNMFACTDFAVDELVGKSIFIFNIENLAVYLFSWLSFDHENRKY